MILRNLLLRHPTNILFLTLQPNQMVKLPLSNARTIRFIDAVAPTIELSPDPNPMGLIFYSC